MATFVVLAGFMDQGIRNAKETISRAEAFKEMAKKSGITVKDLYWTLGQYDVIAVSARRRTTRPRPRFL